MNLYFNSTDWSKEQSSKHSIHMQIFKFASELGVSFAFPSTTLMIEQFPEKKYEDLNYSTEEERINQILNNLNKK